LKLSSSVSAPSPASAEDGAALGDTTPARFQFAAEIMPTMLPVDRRHDLLVALRAHCLLRHRPPHVGGARDQLRPAGFLQKYADADCVFDAGAAERHAVIGDENGPVAAERTRQRLAFALLDQ